MIAIVIGTFCLCWFPHSIGVFCIIDPNCNWDDSFFVATTWLAMLNSAMNSIIYGLMNRSFRRAFKSVLCCDVGNEDLATNIQQERITGDRKSNLLNRYSQHQQLLQSPLKILSSLVTFVCCTISFHLNIILKVLQRFINLQHCKICICFFFLF